MASRRIERLNEQLKRELAVRLRGDTRDPRIRNVTVTGVRTAPDLTFARVLVRIVGDEAERTDALAGLEAAGPWLRRELGRTLHVRRVPELSFRIDQSLEDAARIEALLDSVRPEGGWTEPAPESVSDVEGDADAGTDPESGTSSRTGGARPEDGD